MQVEAGKWLDGAAKFQADGNPGYVNFLNDQKEICGGLLQRGFMNHYSQWLKEHPNGENTPSPRSDGS